MNHFEVRIRRRLEEFYPCCTLSGVTLYRPDRFGSGDPFGYEIDNMLHWQSGADDRIVILECKDAPIRVASTTQAIPPQNQEWYAPINSGPPKNLKDQLFNQAESVWQNLCIPPNPRRRIDAFVVTSLPTQRLKCSLYSEAGLTLHLITEMELIDLFRNPPNLANALDTAVGGRFLRVAQSDLLRMARQSVVVPELGHPEIDHAIEMIRRCQQTLDGRLFDFFKPKERRWAINGAAGMGKSVLLAYTATVFSTGRALREIPRQRNDRTPIQTELVEHENDTLKLPSVGQRRILVVGLKPRQLDVLRDFWQSFYNRFKQLAGHYLPVAQPQFARLSSALDLSGFNIICIDEAHDLPVADQERLAAWWEAKPGERYLVIACDRHQRLRFSTAEQDRHMIKGIPFSGCSTRLSRNYRSPTAVYCAGLALMFRWFARSGAKVVPEKSHLEESFGFQVRLADRRVGGRVALTLVNDAHPANHWRFTVSRFTHTDAAFAWLDTNNLRKEDVLWVRFAEEFPEAEHDSEHIKERFNYKALNSFNPQATIDAEIKGRDFPVVVVEGFPRGMAATPVTDDVWGLRRQVYLCASRATAFLFFIFGSSGSEESVELEGELETLLRALGSPEDPNEASTKKWSFEFGLPEAAVGMDVFVDDVVAETSALQSPEDIGGHEKPNAVPELVTLPPTKLVSAAQPLPAQIAAEPPLAASPSVEVPITPAENKPIEAAIPKANQHDAPRILEVPLRVHDIARLIGFTSQELIEHLKRSNYKVERATDTVDRITAEALIRERPPKPILPPSETAAAGNVAPEEKLASAKSDVRVLMSEKDFQRRYGHIKNWKKDLYERYRETGTLPTYVKPKVLANGGSEKPFAPKNRNGFAPKVPQQASRPVHIPPPSLTVQQLASYLDVKTFKLISALRQSGSGFISPEQFVVNWLMEAMCRKFNRPIPTDTQLVQLAGISPAQRR